MKFVEALGAAVAPMMQGKQVPISINGHIQQAQRLLGVPSDLVYFDAEVQTELTLLASEYYGMPPAYAWDKYNWDAEALGQKLLVRGYALPDIDVREPLIQSEADLEKLKWPTSNPLDAGRYPVELQLAEVAGKYYPYRFDRLLTVSSYSLACNLCGGSAFLTMPLEEPEFCHKLLQKITDDIHTPLVKAAAERFPGITVSIADAWEAIPNVSESIMREFAWAYYDRLKENVKGINVNLQWFVTYGEQYMKDPYSYLIEKGTKYSHMVSNTNLEKCDPEIYHRVALDTGMPLCCYIPTTIIQDRDKQKIIEFVREQAKAQRPGVSRFIWMLMCPATASEYDIKSIIAIAKAFGQNPIPTPEEIDRIQVELPIVEESLCDFARRKKAENPDGFKFKWLDETKFAE